MGLVLWGYQSSGKTSVARAYATRYQIPHLDLDEAVLAHYHAESGKHFLIMKDLVHHLGSREACREIETDVITHLTFEPERIISTGGWSILNPDNVTRLRQHGACLYLEVSPDILFHRMRQRGWPSFIRPEYAQEDFHRYYESRLNLYENACDVRVNVSHLSVDDIVSYLGKMYGQ